LGRADEERRMGEGSGEVKSDDCSGGMVLLDMSLESRGKEEAGRGRGSGSLTLTCVVGVDGMLAVVDAAEASSQGDAETGDRGEHGWSWRSSW
jgi:hypothetical protein